MIMKIFITLLSVFLCTCSKNKLPEYNHIDSMRIFAMKADFPERQPGQTATITPVISDIKGNGRPLTFTASACLDPGIAYGHDPECNGALHAQTLASGAVTGLSSPNYTGAVNTVAVTIPADILAGKSTIEQLIGVTYIVVYRIASADGTSVTAVKRIKASLNPTPNNNPTLSSILADNSTLSSLPSTHVTFTPNYTGSSEETYQTVTNDGTIGSKTESLITSWFVSEGALDYLRTTGRDGNGYTINYRPSSAVVIMGVLRDDRGGEDFIKLEL